MPFNLNFKYYFPPRPEYMISYKELYKYESEYCGQPKMNGACTMIYIKNMVTNIHLWSVVLMRTWMPV